jgi:transcriptional regulator with XRE-family HTH domain
MLSVVNNKKHIFPKGPQMAFTDHFGAKLRELRQLCEWSQKQLAEESGVLQATIAQLESGRNRPTFETVVKLAAALGVDCREFLKPPADVTKPGKGRPRKTNSD